MMDDRRRAVDTSVLVNFFTGGAGSEEPEWLRHSEWTLQAALDGNFRLVLPAICMAELAGAGSIRGCHLDPSVQRERTDRVRKWLRSTSFLIVEIDGRVANCAVDLAIRHQLKGPDACVIAASLLGKASILYSWDSDHLKLNGKIPGLAIEKPCSAGGQAALLTISESQGAAVGSGARRGKFPADRNWPLADGQ